MNLSKSRFCNGMQCKKMLWMEINKPDKAQDLANEAILDNGNAVHDVARNLLGEHHLIMFNDNLDIMIQETKEKLAIDNIIIAEASFKYQNNFCSVDLLRKRNNEYEIYEVKGATAVKDVFILDVSYQLYVLTNLGYHVKKCYIVTLNSDYERKGELELNKLFNINDYTQEAYERQNDIAISINEINDYIEQQNEPKDDLDQKCFKPYMCPFFGYCTRNLPVPNVFDIKRMFTSKKIKLYKEGIYCFEDLLKEPIDQIFKQQIEHELYQQKDEINKEKIKEFLATLSYPLYFLDFETINQPIPQYDGVRPYEQVPFQYSLHYLEKDVLGHKEFLAEAGHDPRRKLALSLIKDIPLNVCVLAYNMSFEKNVIKKLAIMFPDLSSHLMNIYTNIKDLMIPFKERYYYNKAMQGSYSIKYVLPALYPHDASLDYHNLDLIHNGSEAMNAFSLLEGKSKEELAYIRERLLRYCELDTYAMVKVYEKLKQIK